MKTIGNIMMVLNEAEFIEAAIRSILPGCDQIIVIDHGSTDGTLDILSHLQAEGHLVYVTTNGQNFLTRGEQFFRNLGIDLCFCDWLMLTDGDEIMGDGWAEIVRACINSPMWDKYGALNGRYWQLIGSSDFVTPDSPLQPRGGMRPLFFRMNKKLRASDPMKGTLCHTALVGIDPPLVGTLNIDLWHMGYAKDPTTRFERNIIRGDWTQDEAEKAEHLRRLRENPLQFLQSCIPAPHELKKRMPASIRESKWRCDYDSASQKITGRHPIAL